MANAVTWGQNGYAAARVVRVADTAANRQWLQQAAATDGTPSAVVKMGQDVALLSGDALRTASRIAGTQNSSNVIQRGATIGIDGIGAQVLSTDDGFSEIDASNVVVAVIDTGVDTSHPALRGRLVQGYNSYDGTSNVTDLDGHGTHVAGTIAGAWGLDSRAGGVAVNAKIMPIRACDDQRRFSDESIYNGIVYAVKSGVRVINISLEDQAELPKTALAIDYARKMGVVVVVASGNEGSSNVSSPARYEGSVAVGSSVGGRRSTFSNGGGRLDMTAPGENIVAPLPGNRYGAKSGTSMAAPYVAGAAALVIARHPEWTVEQICRQIASTATDYGTPGKDVNFGHGEVNLFEAVYGGPGPSVRRVVQGSPITEEGLGSRLMNWFNATFNR
jgi:subtilisin family serine protease